MIRTMNGRILIVTMHNKYGERQVYIMPETFAVEVETNETKFMSLLRGLWMTRKK